jgi:hypothetical protein
MQEMLAGQAKKNKVEYGVTVMHPRDISAGMLQKTNYSLCVVLHPYLSKADPKQSNATEI